MYGTQIAKSEFAEARSVIGCIETTPAGNIALYVGHEIYSGDDPLPRGWGSTEHVVLTQEEATNLAEALLGHVNHAGLSAEVEEFLIGG
jgi:hypothetical protein